MTKIEGSSMISKIIYNSEELKMTVTFYQGRVYEYFYVTQEVHDELLKARSMGHYFQKKIAPFYKHREIINDVPTAYRSGS